MVLPLAIATAIKGLGGVAAALAAAGALVLPTGRARAISAVVALALAPVLLVGELWTSPQIHNVRAHTALAVFGVVAAIAVVAALAAAIRRAPWIVAPLAVAALPFRIPLESGGESANLLLPLYLVVAAGVAAYAWDRLVVPLRHPVGVSGNGSGDPGPWRDGPASRLEIALVAFVVLYSLQALYSSDFETALKNLAFFYVPFMLMLKLLVSVPWTRRVVFLCLAVSTGLALVFAGIGFEEYATRHLFWNQKVIASNEFESYFRVNSLFFDPNIYGRFLAMTMLMLATTLLWPRRGREVALTSGVLAVLWAALVITFSQSSFAALLVGLAVLAALRFGWRPVGMAVGAVAVAAIAFVLIAPGVIHLNLNSKGSVSKASSGRLDLLRGGLSMFVDRPLTGFGAGSFAQRYRERERAGSREAASASHTIPITVAAEQGILGLAAYVFVLVSAFTLLYRGLGPLRGRAPPPRLITRAYIAAAFTGLILHTFLYAAFLEDPITWALLAAGLVLAGGQRTAPVTASAGQAARGVETTS